MERKFRKETRQALETTRMDGKDAALLNPLQLAYMGDSVWEIMVRSRLLFQRKNVRHMHTECVNTVNAAAQAALMEKLRPALTETEAEIYRRGRNAHPHHPSPRNQNPADYAEATGFEAVLGYLYAAGEYDRLKELEDMLLNPEKDGTEASGNP